MQNQKATKWLVGVLIIICLGQALYIYGSTQNSPEPTKLVSTTLIGERGAIYEILSDNGGATVPLTYNYYLMNVQIDDSTALVKAKDSHPFLTTKSSGAIQEVLPGKVKLKTTDTVFNYSSIGYYKVDEKINIINFEIEATMP
ncbi:MULTISPECIES: hypothetical protein [Pseudomonas]|uniref:hypothetical protein n=1 Tax=Pseudomonas TaxID=286 RepID=UPI0016002457|nr:MULTISPECIES: hypothetical protein [Pseudomonas]QYM99645.1 hypothetical protein K1T36_21520 [Pseudomonas protegens]